MLLERVVEISVYKRMFRHTLGIGVMTSVNTPDMGVYLGAFMRSFV